MTEKRSIQNPFKSIHAAALINFGEACSGLAVLTALENSTDKLRGIVVNLNGKFFKKAKGTLRASCKVPFQRIGGMFVIPLGSTVIPVDLLDASGTTVATITAEWTFSNQSSKVKQ